MRSEHFLVEKIKVLTRDLLWNTQVFIHNASLSLFEHPSVRRTRKNGGFDGFDDDSGYFWPGEAVEILFIWSIEFFTPSSLNTVEKNLTKLGWNIDKDGRESALDWLRSSRRLGTNGGWRNLGYVSRNRPREMFSSFHTTAGSLPTKFAGASASLFSITPSLSAIVFGFKLSNEARNTYSDIIESHFFTELRPKGKRITSILSPPNIKREKIRDARIALQSEISQWVAKEFQGIISNSDQPNLPCIEFLQINSVTRRDSWKSLSRFFFSDSPFDRWESEAVPGLTFHARPLGDGVVDFASLSISQQDIDNVTCDSFGDNRSDALETKMNFHVPNLIVSWGCNCLLDVFSYIVADTRDRQIEPITKEAGERNFVAATRRWNQQLDIRVIADDILRLDSKYVIGRPHGYFTTSLGKKKEKVELGAQLGKNAMRLARSISHSLASVSSIQREVDSTYALIQSAVFGRRSVLIAILSALLAFIALVISVITLILAWLTLTPEQIDKFSYIVKELFE